jgi:hypothetical protein
LSPADDRDDLEDGVRLRFPAAEGMLSAITRAVDAERACCRFLRFTITIEPDGGPITLELTGPPGTRDFLVALLDQ